MKRSIAVLALTVVLLGSVVAPASADPVGPSIGPVCMSMLPFTNLLVLYFTPDGVNQLLINGKDAVVGPRAVSGAASLTGSPAQLLIGFTLHARSAAANSSIGGGTLSLATLSGPGFARAVDGGNFEFTLAIIPCPVGATSGAGDHEVSDPAVARNSP